MVVRRARGSGIATLEVDESWFDKHPEGVEFALHALCRYEPDTQTWTRLPRPDHGWSWTIPGRKEVPAPAHGPRLQPLVTLPSEPGLYWAQWIERPDGGRSLGAEDVREALLPSGPGRCNDTMMTGPVPTDRIVACVPFKNRAEATFVPAPREACAR